MNTVYHLIFSLGTLALLYIRVKYVKGFSSCCGSRRKGNLTPKILVIFHIQIYLEKYKFKNAKTSDFWRALEEVRESASPNISLSD